MKNVLITTLVGVFLTGCMSAGDIESVGGEFAPVNSETAIQHITYISTGLSFIAKARRDDAMEKMYNFCNGKYEIVNEESETRGSTGMGFNSLGNTVNTYSSQSKNRVIAFRCIQ